MGLEGNNYTPEDICGNNGEPYFSEGNLDIPEGIRYHISSIHDDASESQIRLRNQIVDNFIRTSVDVSTGDSSLDDYVYREIFAQLYVAVTESRGTLEDVDFSEYALRSIFIAALNVYKLEKPVDFLAYSQRANDPVIFGDKSVDISLLVEFILSQDSSREDTIQPSQNEEVGIISVDEVVRDFREGLYSRDEVISILEGEEGFREDRNNGFSLSNALEMFGFGDTLQRDINTIFEKELGTEESANLLHMVKYFLYVESSGGYNVSNYEGVSTAKGYFQYLTGNGKYLREIYENDAWIQAGDWSDEHSESDLVRRIWGTNSYETALGHIPESVLDARLGLRQEIAKLGNPDLQDPRDLSSDEQILLFLSDLLQRPGASELIPQMLEGDIRATQELYRLHHTNTDEATELRMLLADRDIYGISIETYSRSERGVVGLILPGQNMTSFFYGLIKEINPNTSFTSSEIMQGLDALGNIAFQAGGRVEIVRSQEDGVAYILTLNGEEYIKIGADKSFTYLR